MKSFFRPLSLLTFALIIQASPFAADNQNSSRSNADEDCDGATMADCPTQVKSPRDAASGLPTGKRQHKPVTVSKEMDKSTPKLMESAAPGGDMDGDGADDAALRESPTKASTGESKRDAASGMPTGKRQHSPKMMDNSDQGGQPQGKFNYPILPAEKSELKEMKEDTTLTLPR